MRTQSAAGYLVVLFATLLASQPARAQAPSPESTSRRAIEAFEVRPGILATVSRDSEGRVIEVVCERFNLRTNLFDLRTHISAEEVDELIDELVPDSIRGRRSSYAEFDLIVGSTSRRSYTYENVDIIRIDALAQDKCGKTVLVIRPGPGVWLPL